MPAYGGGGRPGQLGNLGDRGSFDIVQLDDQALPGRHRRDHGADPVHDFSPLGSLGWRLIPRRDELGKAFPLTALRSDHVEGSVRHDSGQPGPERPPDLEIVDVAKRRKESVLNHVFGVRVVANDSHRQPDGARKVETNKLPERLPVTTAGAFDQGAFTVGVGGLLERQLWTKSVRTNRSGRMHRTLPEETDRIRRCPPEYLPGSARDSRVAGLRPGNVGRWRTREGGEIGRAH